MAIMTLRNFWNHSPSDIAPHPGRRESSHVTVLEMAERFNTWKYVKDLILLGSDFVN